MSPKDISEMMKEQEDYAKLIIINNNNHAVDDLSHMSPQNVTVMMKE